MHTRLPTQTSSQTSLHRSKPPTAAPDVADGTDVQSPVSPPRAPSSTHQANAATMEKKSFPGLQDPTQHRVSLPEEGEVATSPEHAEQLQNAAYTNCYNPRCDFHIAPEAAQSAADGDGWYTCPNCQQEYHLLAELPFEGEMYAPGGKTIVGLSMREQGKLGEQVVRNLGQIPGYGPITWWSEEYQNPLDGGTAEWGIEVKTINTDALHHRFIPGRAHEKEAKNVLAAEMGYKGVLGVLVIVDYKRSVADIYVKEMPLEGWTSTVGRQIQGIAAFRKHNSEQIHSQHPFENPFMDPSASAPEVTTFGGNDDIPF